MAGDVYHNWDQEGQFFFLTVQDGNSILGQGWTGLYRVISYANSIINDLPPAASGNVPESAINKALGEAHFFRAAAYYFLAEFWGDVPIVENATALVTSNNLILPKNTRASIYEFMRRDLEYAETNLPATDDPGRVTKWSAKGLLAKMYLTMAQNDKTQANFDKAKQYADDVIKNSGAALMTNYADLWKIQNNNNSESLWSLQWIMNGWSFGNSRQSVFGRSSVITGNTQAWGGGKSLTYGFMQDVEFGDARRKSIYMAPGDVYPEINVATGGYTYNIVNRDNAGTVLESAAPLLNNIKKYIVGSSSDVPGVGSNQDVAQCQPFLRLADVYLIYVEAAIGNAESTAEVTALDYFNTIRRRAQLPEKSSVTFLELMKERRIEFAVEGIRWFDIKRFYYRNPTACLTYINGQDRGSRYVRNTDNSGSESAIDGYTLTAADSPITVTAEDMFVPIPVGEVGQNPLLGPTEAAVDYQFQ
jgi:starch-binding outer membrane protein, SusD/RagB family